MKYTNRKAGADYIMQSKAGLFVVAVIAALAGIFFILTQGVNEPIERSEAVAYSGEFEEYDAYSDNYRTIYFKDGSSYDVYAHTETEEFLNKMLSLEEGTVLYLLVNPNNEYVVEVRTESEEILNFVQSQEDIKSYSNGYIGIGVFMIFVGVFSAALGFAFSASKKKEEARRKERDKKRADGKDDLAMRHAKQSVKMKILLEAKVEEYNICYRRVKSVNELVINGAVYDERKGIIEFAHNLSAVVGGHTIEAGLDDRNYSYIVYDGCRVAEKRRLI
jgi:hypothetical protein